MDKLKPWQTVLMIVAVLVLAVSVWRSMSGESVEQPDRVSLVDIATGDRFYVKTGGRRLTILPERHPDTGERTLYPVLKDEDGNWVVSPLLRGDLTAYEGDKSALASAEGFVVNLTEVSPRALD